MSTLTEKLNEFVAYASSLKGYEKGEGQLFCQRLFQAFGHVGLQEAGASLETRIKKASGKGVKFADLLWKPRLLLEMKRGGEPLHLHYRQAFDYWITAVPNRPRYVVLSNFREFWIYDFDKQLDEPVDIVTLSELSTRYTALNFMFPDEREPIFNNDREAVSRGAADQIADLFKSLRGRVGNAVDRTQAQRFVLQLVVAMFAEDIELLPRGIVHTIVRDCLEHNQSAFDLFAGLFKQMNNPKPASGGRFKGVRYFNGGLFGKIDPVELKQPELKLLAGPNGAASRDWTKVNPAIFGTLFQHSMDAKARHALGAHFTSEADIERIVSPTIVRPWMQRIDTAKTAADLLKLRGELAKVKVLDPSCGSGNFLYVAFRELARLDLRIMARLKEILSPKEFSKRAPTLSMITPKQFFGLDIDGFGVELAKVTLMLAKKLVLDEAAVALDITQEQMALDGSDGLPLDNLDGNIRCEDALFAEWPKVDYIIGNPPYQAKNKMQGEIDGSYIDALRERFPDVDGRTDYCAYWFRRAHDLLKPGQRAGLVGTNTIRQNYTREASLDYITSHGGTIIEAVSSMVWPGEAVVHVSIVNWIKGSQSGKKRLYTQDGDVASGPWRYEDLDKIGAALSFTLDVTQAKALRANSHIGGCFQGQTHGHKGFLVSEGEARLLIAKDPPLKEVLHPFLIAKEMIQSKSAKPNRYVIDFHGLNVIEAQEYQPLFDRVKKAVLPTRKAAADKEQERNDKRRKGRAEAKGNNHHKMFLKQWWVLSYPREDLLLALSKLQRYVVCGRVTRRPIFEFVSTKVRPNDALQVFPYDDDYSFGILQSDVHWTWFENRCSTLKSDYRYTSNTVFDSFPWPQSPSQKAVERVAGAAVNVRTVRDGLCQKHNLSFRDLYKSLEVPGQHPLKDANSDLAEAVRVAYGFKGSNDLKSLLDLNLRLAQREDDGQSVAGPGLPSTIKSKAGLVTVDCIEP